MSKKDRHYKGWAEDKQIWEAFDWDLPEEPTPEETGYDEIEGPLDEPYND